MKDEMKGDKYDTAIQMLLSSQTDDQEQVDECYFRSTLKVIFDQMNASKEPLNS